MRIFFARVFVLVVVCTRTVTSFVRVKDSELSSVLQGRFRAYPCGSTSVTLPAVEKFDQFFKIIELSLNLIMSPNPPYSPMLSDCVFQSICEQMNKDFVCIILLINHNVISIRKSCHW